MTNIAYWANIKPSESTESPTHSYHTMHVWTCGIFGCRNGLILKGTQLLINYYILSHEVCLNNSIILCINVSLWLVRCAFLFYLSYSKQSGSGFERSGPAFTPIFFSFERSKLLLPVITHVITCSLSLGFDGNINWIVSLNDFLYSWIIY